MIGNVAVDLPMLLIRCETRVRAIKLWMGVPFAMFISRTPALSITGEVVEIYSNIQLQLPCLTSHL